MSRNQFLCDMVILLYHVSEMETRSIITPQQAEKMRLAIYADYAA